MDKPIFESPVAVSVFSWVRSGRAGLCWFAASLAVLGVQPVVATTLYWGGGTTDIADGTPLTLTTAGLTGTWDDTTQNWAIDHLGTTYSAFVPGAYAVVGYYFGGSSNFRVPITLASDVSVSGLHASMQSLGSGNANQGYSLQSGSTRTLTLAGSSPVIRVIATDNTRAIRVESDVKFSGTAPVQITGGGTLDLRTRNDGLTGSVELRSGTLILEKPSWPPNSGGSISSVQALSVRGYPSASVQSYSLNAFETPVFRVQSGPGLNNQLHDTATVTLSSGEFDYRGRGHPNAASASSEVMGRIALDPHGKLNLSGGSTGTHPGTLLLNDASAGINRGPNGRGTLIVGVQSDDSPRVQATVANGVTLGGLLPWISHNRAGFIRLNPTTKIIENVPVTDAPTALNTWVAASDYRAGNNSAFVPSGSINSMIINSLGLFINPGSTTATTIPIASGNTLTIASGGIAFQPTRFGAHVTLSGGFLTSGTDQLHLHSGDSANSAALKIDSAIVGTGMDVIKAGVANVEFIGTANNTFSGTMYVNKGHVILGRTGGAVSVPGDLVIRRSGSAETTSASPFGPASRLTIESGGMFVANAIHTQGGRVTINGGRYHLLNHKILFADGLSFNGGVITHNSTVLGTIRLGGGVSYAATSTAQAVWTRYGTGLFTVELDGANRTFDIAAASALPAGTPEMVFDISITNGTGTAANSGITKTGSGTLKFTMTNYYGGPTIIENGTLHVGTHSASAQSGLRASLYGGGPNFDSVVFDEPIAGDLVRGQLLTGTGMGANRTVLQHIDEHTIMVNGGGQTTTNATDLAAAAVLRYGSLGTGPVTVDGGTLLVDAGITLANGVTVNGGTITNQGVFTGSITVNGGTLAGNGSYNGAATLFGGVIEATLNNGATVNGNLYPAGNAIGTMQVNGHVTWNSGNSWSSATDWHFQLGAAPASDRLSIDGDFTLGAGSAFRFDFQGSGQVGTYTLVEWTGSTTFSASDFSYVNLAPGLAASFQIVGSSLQVVVSGCAVNPTITLGQSPPAICSPVSPVNSSIGYSAVSENPTHYSIDFSDAANAVGFADTLPAILPASPIPFTIPANVPGGVYTGKVIVLVGATGCRGEAEFTVTVLAAPAMPGVITQGNPAGTTVCAGSTFVTYSISPVSGATTYTWTLPNKATLLSGQGTTQIAVNWASDTGAGDLSISVQAGNDCGSSANRTGIFTVRTGPPGAPTADQPTEVSISSFTANWSAPAFVTGQNVEGYRLDVSTASDFSSGHLVTDLALSSSTLSYTLTGLSGGLTYYYRVRAVNACGESLHSATVTALTPLVLAGWDVSPQPGGNGAYGTSPLNATFKHPAVGLVGLTRGAGVTQSGTGAPRGWGGTGWNAASAAAAAAANQVATFAITPESGNYLSFYSINLFDYRRSGDGPTHGELAYSTDGSTFHAIGTVSYSSSSAEGGTVAALPVDLSGIAALQNVAETDTITFRIANYGASSAHGDWYIYDRFNSVGHDFELRGTVCSNPPSFNLTGGGAYCDGGSGVSVGLSGSTIGVTYHLYRDNNGSPVLVASRAGTGSAVNFGLQTVADTYTATAVRNSGGCDSAMNGSVVITINPTPGAPTGLVAVPDDSSVDLSWTAPVGDTVTGYRVKRATGSGGPYSVVTGGDNIAGTTFTDASALNGAIYYYVITALNDGCEGDPSNEAEAEMPDGCPSGFVPTMNHPGNRTANVGYTLTHSISASEITEGCTAPSMSQSALPTGMNASDSVNGQVRTRTFVWTPQQGQQGVYPITVTATDNENFSTSITFVVYVGNFGETGNGTANPPPSQAAWHVDIASVDHETGNDFEVVWQTSPGVAYDLYQASTFPGGTWTKVLAAAVTMNAANDHVLSHTGERTYVQVVPAGMAAKSVGVWAIMTPAIPSGISMQSVPLPTDRNFSGTMGATLAAALPENTDVYIMTPGNNAAWTTLRRNGAGAWVHLAGPAVTTLNPGQGFFVNRPGGTEAPLFMGPVGNHGTSTNTLVAGYNLIALSEGRSLAANTAFESASPSGDPGGNESLSDQVILMNANGSWRRLIRRSNGTWYDTATPNAPGNTSLQLPPGGSYYYIRRNSNTTVTF